MTSTSPRDEPTRSAGSPGPNPPAAAAQNTPPEPLTTSGSAGPGRARRWLWLSVVAGLVLLLVVGLAGYRLGSGSAAPAEGSADVGFARDMQTHHAQAVQMAMIIRDKTSDPTLTAVADDILTSQQHQTGQMYAWLVGWGLPQTGTDAPMAWMSQGTHASSGQHTAPSTASDSGSQQAPTGMGMATAEQITALQQATGRDAERLFLQLMITHHHGGVAMAKTALQQADRPEVRTLAAAIDTAQTAEIDQLQHLLEQRP